jgi:hypothetical protein
MGLPLPWLIIFWLLLGIEKSRRNKIQPYGMSLIVKKDD